jgi:hypothetical protein
MNPVARRAALVLCALGLLPWALHGLEPPARSPFAAEIARLSEPEGAFDTDNLVSNEGTYLTVVPALVAGGVRGGVYIGVGPDQNFSYIARVRPALAYIVDVRRDNLLLHLLLKAIFARAPTRVEYLSLLTGRGPPAQPSDWHGASIDRIVAHVDAAQPQPAAVRLLRRRLEQTISGFGVPLSAEDHASIERFHQAFVNQGLDLRFQSHGRPPRAHYPTLRDLVRATDQNWRQWSYLASEDDYRFLRTLQMRDGLIPVVGDVSGTHALQAIAAGMSARGEHLSAFYISNVEDYLFREGRFGRFVDNVGRLPLGPHSVMIRAIFGGGGSVTVLQRVDEMLSAARLGKYRSYWDLAGRR